MSTSKFVDAGYTVVYDDKEVNYYEKATTKIIVSEEAVLRGWRCPRDKLWRVPLTPDVRNQKTDTIVLDHPLGHASLNSMYEVASTTITRQHIAAISLLAHRREYLHNVYELPSIEPTIRYLHAAAGYPVKATWLKAIRNGNFSTWPLINVKNVAKHFPESEETQFGHMRGQRQGVRSTRPTPTPQIIPDIVPTMDTTAPLNVAHDVLIRTVDLHDTLYTDQTGRFPVVSSLGNRYVMVLHHVDSNSSWIEGLKNNSEGELILARRRALVRMTRRGIKPRHQILDNQASAAYKAEIELTQMTYELVPPDDHRRNLAEKAIQTVKDHMVSVLSGCAPTMPMHLWCQLLPQIERQLLLLRQSSANPSISAYAHVYGHHDYNRHPFVPIGMEALVHDRPHNRRTYAQHCRKAYVLGTSFEHYRCWKFWTTATRATRTSGAAFFKHKYITNPTVTPQDRVIAAAGALAHALHNRMPPHMQAPTIQVLQDLQNVFQQAAINYNSDPLTHVIPDDDPRVPVDINPSLSPATPPRVGQPRMSSRLTPSRTIQTNARSPRVAPPVTPTRLEFGNSPITPRRGQVEQSQHSPRLPPPSDPPPPRRAKRAPPVQYEDAPSRNTRSRTQLRTLTQETLLSCVHIHNFVSGKPFTAAQAAQRRFPPEILNAVLDAETGALMEMRHLLVNPKYKELWGKSYTTELGRLAQGIPGKSKGTNTIVFIKRDDVPIDRRRDVTYGRVCVNYRPEKADPNRTRLTVGGNRITYPGDCGTPTVDMITVKIHLNSTISTKGARYCTIDLKDFYLNTPMERPEFMRMKLADLPEDFAKMYNLHDLVDDQGHVSIKIQKGMYGLPQAGILAQELLEKRLNTHGYRQSAITPGLWRHDFRPISFTLCVDDFGIKYIGREHVDHLSSILNEHYKCSQDWNGARYLGMNIDWDYINKNVHVSMLDYVPEALVRFQHPQPIKPQHQPYPHVKPIYGATKQYVMAADTSSPLNKAGKKFIQEVIGTFLYYARCVDSTMLAALGSLATQQANPTTNTMSKVKQFLDYAATHPDAIVTYQASNMVLAAHSDASYLSESNARSRAGGHFFMSSNVPRPPNNGAILTIAQIIKAVMSSAAEAEVGALYINCREAVPARQTLEFLGHAQPPTPIQTDNTTALGVVNNNVMKKLKAMDMKFHWLRDRISQKQFRHYWAPGSDNKGDYVTKHHPPVHHEAMRSTFLTSIATLQALRKRVSNLLPAARVC
jgi:hypothetical protein